MSELADIGNAVLEHAGVKFRSELSLGPEDFHTVVENALISTTIRGVSATVIKKPILKL